MDHAITSSVKATATRELTGGMARPTRGRHLLRSDRSTSRAAWRPLMPWTPPPGGVDEEQMNTAGSGVVYGFQRTTGRNRSWRQSPTPPLMSPPT